MGAQAEDLNGKAGLYRLLVEHAADCIWLYDLTHQHFRYISPSILQLRGYTPEEAMNERLEDSLSPESLATMRRFSQNLPVDQDSGDIAFTQEYQQICRDGSVKPVEITTRLLDDPETGALCILGISRDITGRRSLEDILRHENSEKDAAIQRLMANESELVSLTRELLSKNESLRQLALTDELTGLNNRYFFDRRIDEEIERAERYEYPLSLILFDLDKFKDVNDTWGHDAGDQVLVDITREIRVFIRKSDILARWGGEEFIVLAPQTSLAGAAILAEKLRRAIRQTSHKEIGPVTASFGIAERLRGESYGAWFRRADEALYRAKRAGRDCVVGRPGDHESPVAQIRLDWKKVWECGHPVIDGQHHKMIELANSLLDQSLTGHGTEPINARFSQLIAHISEHFAAEEKILADIGFPEISQHIGRHRNLIRKAQRLNSNFLKADLKPSALFAYIVDDVVVGHLLTDDVLYFPYIRIQGGDAHGSENDH